MANRLHSSILPTLFIFAIILAFTIEASAGRVIHESSVNVDEKQPEWFFGSYGGTPIHGIGEFPLPFSSGNSGSFGGGSSGGYLPGGDDTFVPNSGNEIPPNPGSGGGYHGSVQTCSIIDCR